jgi:hypothetical protein
VGEIDNFSICGNLYVPCWANLNNAVSLDQDDLIGRKLVTSVNQMAGMNRNPVIRRWGRLTESQRADR